MFFRKMILITLLVIPLCCEQGSCARLAGDINGDGKVDMVDLSQTAAKWLDFAGWPYDINNDGSLTFVDLSVLANNWQKTATSSVVDVTSYGATGNGITNDTAAITSAVAVLTPNDVLLFPKASNYYKVNVGANFTINDAGVRVVIQGKISSTGNPASGQHIFYVDAADCTFVGEGGQAIIEGSGTYRTEVDDAGGPGLIRLTSNAQHCRIDNLQFNSPRHFGICVYGANDVTVENCTFSGGPSSALSGTQLQALFFSGANGLIVRNNLFAPNAGGGKMHHWIGSSGTTESTGISIVGNRFDSSYYSSMSIAGIYNSIISGNISQGAAGTGFKITGTDNVIAKNSIFNDAGGGIYLGNACGCIVSNNSLNGVGYTGIEISPAGTDTGSYSYNSVVKNYIKGISGGTVYEGIRVYSSGGTVTGTKVEGNTIRGMGISSGRAAISIQSVSLDSYGCAVNSNIIDQCGNGGVELARVNRSSVLNNIIQVPSGKSCISESLVIEANLRTDNIEKVY